MRTLHSANLSHCQAWRVKIQKRCAERFQERVLAMPAPEAASFQSSIEQSSEDFFHILTRNFPCFPTFPTNLLTAPRNLPTERCSHIVKTLSVLTVPFTAASAKYGELVIVLWGCRTVGIRVTASCRTPESAASLQVTALGAPNRILVAHDNRQCHPIHPARCGGR